MRLFAFIIAVLCSLNQDYQDKDPLKSEAEFEQYIVGKWELVEFYVNDYKQVSSPDVVEYDEDGTFYQQTRYPFGNKQKWKYYPYIKVMLMTDVKSEFITRYKLLELSSDTLKIETVQPTGATILVYTKLKNK